MKMPQIVIHGATARRATDGGQNDERGRRRSLIFRQIKSQVEFILG